jgi:hypothetical protein
MFQSVEELSQKLSETGYFIDPTMTKVVFLADQMNKPLLLEGPAGSGKTLVARSLAESMQLSTALDRRPQAAATWSQRAACARGMESGAEQPAGGDLPRRVRGHPRPPRRGGDGCHLRRHRTGIPGRVGRCRSTSPRLGDWRDQPPRHAGRCDPFALRMGDGDCVARSAGTGAHLQAGDGVRLPRSRDSGRDGVAHPGDERARPASSGQPGTYPRLSERAVPGSSISRRSSRAARRTIRGSTAKHAGRHWCSMPECWNG